MDASHFNDFLFCFSLLFAFNTALVKSSFPLLVHNFDSNRDTSRHLQSIESLWHRKGILDILSLARLFYTTLAAFSLWQILPDWFSFFKLHLLSPLPEALFVSFFLYLITVFLPYILAQYRPYTLALPSLVLFRFTLLLFWIPGRFAYFIFKKTLHFLGYDSRLNFLTDEEKKQFEADTSAEDQLEDDEKQMIRAIFEFGETPVQEIMTPRIDVITLESNSSLEEVSKIINDGKHTRIPVFEDKIDNIIGFLHNKDFIKWLTQEDLPTFQLTSLIRQAYFVSHKAKIDTVMREMRNSRNHIAIVLDEYGGTDGIVTLEDILEEIVGEIYDEDDPEEVFIQEVRPNTFIVNPIITLNELRDNLGVDLPELDDIDTLGGLIQHELAAIPRRGAVLMINNLEIKVIKIIGQRMVRVLIKKETF